MRETVVMAGRRTCNERWASAAVCVLAWWAIAQVAAAGGESSLVEAARNGMRAEVHAILEQGVDVNGREADGTTALHWAVRADDIEMIRSLLRAGALVAVANRYGVTPLSLAATNGNAAAIEALLAAGADANTSLPEGETVLMTAARTGDRDSVAALLNHGASVNGRESWMGETALMWAAAENHPDVVKLLVERGAELNARSWPQEFAKFRFNLATMVNTVLPRGRMTALMMAARQGALESVRVLVDRGADLDLTDPDDTTALVLAIINGHFDAAALLAERGAAPDIGDSSGMAALYAAVDMHTQPEMINRPTRKPSGSVGAEALIRSLLARGADPDLTLRTPLLARYHNTGDTQLGAGATPLMRAAKSLDLPVMRMLLESGANPARETRAGMTALMFAAAAARSRPENAVKAIELCIARGADVNHANAAGQTAVHLAVDQSDDLIRFLASKGARLDAKDRQGRTPLDVAMSGQAAGRAAARTRDQRTREDTVALLRELGATSSTR
jgi:ankyrin repeat protein